jgi:hypothetical protein
MHVLVVFESIYGHTRRVAEAIGEGLQASAEVRVVPVGEAPVQLLDWAELVVAGGPTHAHGMSRASTRKGALDEPAKNDGWNEMALDPSAAGPGIREWLESLPVGHGKRAAAFDTRVKAPVILTGRASGAIAKALRGHGFEVVAEPESFLVDTHTRLVEGELERAKRWGASLVPTPVAAGAR